MTTTKPTPSRSDGIVQTDALGLDTESGRCWTCDCRYCGLRCHAATGTQYVVGIGYRTPEVAARWAAAGREVRPGDEGWVTPRPAKPEPVHAGDVQKRLSELMRAKETAASIGLGDDVLDKFEAAIVEQSDLLELCYYRPEWQ